MPDATIVMSSDAALSSVAVALSGGEAAVLVVLELEPLSIQAVNKEVINNAARYLVTANFIGASPR